VCVCVCVCRLVAVRRALYRSPCDRQAGLSAPSSSWSARLRIRLGRVMRASASGLHRELQSH